LKKATKKIEHDTNLADIFGKYEENIIFLASWKQVSIFLGVGRSRTEKIIMNT
jgi:hypothetical protein